MTRIRICQLTVSINRLFFCAHDFLHILLILQLNIQIDRCVLVDISMCFSLFVFQVTMTMTGKV